MLLSGGAGMTYAAPAMVAIANGFTMLLFLIRLWVAGDSAVKTQVCRSCVTRGIVVCIAVLSRRRWYWLSGER